MDKNDSEAALPTRLQSFVFRGKAFLLQQKRFVENLSNGNIKRCRISDALQNADLIAESKTALWTEDAAAEQFLLAGKIQNLRLGIKRINNLEIAAGEIFSFWANVGKINRRSGYVTGRELREGCIIPNIGGGLCQLSNALYDAALTANFEIVERHAHSQIIAGSLAERGRDATVFWNYIDLRFKSDQAFRIEAKLTDKHLIVRLRSLKSVRQSQKIEVCSTSLPLDVKQPQSCATCGVNDCFRSLKIEENKKFGRTAFLADEFSPEFDLYLQQIRQSNDLLFVPLDGQRFNKANYAWTTKNFGKMRQSVLPTLMRAYKSRKLAAQGASRQLNLLDSTEKLAADYAKNLPFDALHVVVQQNLLPFLWRGGCLGGRTFDVLMTALPMRNLQQNLDAASALHPESQTLGDFRADARLIADENEALENAAKIITPHTAIAALFPEKAVLLDWQMSALAPNFARREPNKPTIVFPASTVGRKGCYELREALCGWETKIKLIVLGAELEGADFWRGFEVERHAQNWLEKADLVVLPAFVEHKPRRLLAAAARGCPVIASAAVGLANVAGVTNIAIGDVPALRTAMAEHIFKFSGNFAVTQPRAETRPAVNEIWNYSSSNVEKDGKTNIY